MANSQTVKVTGLRELGEAMRALSADIATKVAFQAVAAGAKVVRDGARARAPIAPRAYVASGSEMVRNKRKGQRSLEVDEVMVQPGNIPRNIMMTKVRRTQLTARYDVGVRGGKKHGYASRIASLVERGTVKMPARPFLRPALEQNLPAVTDAMARRLRLRIAKASSRVSLP